MGLVLPQEVEVKWRTQTKEHYINMGYTYTNNGDIFKCNVVDISIGSAIKVAVRCDFCNSVRKIQYKGFLCLQSDKYCCPDCLSHKKKTRDQDGNLIFVEIPYRNKEWLYQKYIVENLQASEIAEECEINVRTLREWISTFDLVNLKSKTDNITKDILYHLFVEEKLTTLQIGKIYNVSDGTILSFLNKYNIQIPTRSELMQRYYYEKGGIKKLENNTEN